MLTEHRKHFKQVWPYKNSTYILLQNDSARPHTSLKTPQAITDFDWSVTQSSLQPQSSALRFPHVLSPEGCDVQHKLETWWWCDSHSENLATWGGHILVMIRLTHTCFLLTLGHRSWRRLGGNIGYGVKPFLMCNFHYSDIYWDKNKGLYFQGIPRKILFASNKTPCLVLVVYSLSSFIHVFLYLVKREVSVKITTKETSILL